MTALRARARCSFIEDGAEEGGWARRRQPPHKNNGNSTGKQRENNGKTRGAFSPEEPERVLAAWGADRPRADAGVHLAAKTCDGHEL
jgi:hypothetical protein